MASRADIIAEARQWLGTPFHHQGRVRGAGVDCLQLLIGVYSAVGLIAPLDVGHYPWDWHFHKSEERYLQGIAEYAKKITKPLPGDIALFTFGHCASHAAIVIAWPLCIHAYHGQGVVETDAENGAELSGRLHSFWSLLKGKS